MYILFNFFNGACLNVGSDMEKAFDCFLAGAVVAGVNLTETVESYRETFRSTQCCSCEHVYLFNSKIYGVANDELIVIN